MPLASKVNTILVVSSKILDTKILFPTYIITKIQANTTLTH